VFLQLFQDRFYSLATQRVVNVCVFDVHAGTGICWVVKGEGAGRASQQHVGGGPPRIF